MNNILVVHQSVPLSMLPPSMRHIPPNTHTEVSNAKYQRILRGDQPLENDRMNRQCSQSVTLYVQPVGLLRPTYVTVLSVPPLRPLSFCHISNAIIPQGLRRSVTLPVGEGRQREEQGRSARGKLFPEIRELAIFV